MKNKKKPSPFPYAFFSAFTTLPAFQQSHQFFIDDINNIFSHYRKGLAEMQEKASGKPIPATESKPFLYMPVHYCLFGEFDIAVFSLIDDFSFATKQFKPQPNSFGFKYQVNSGIIPMIDAYEGIGKLPQFRDLTVPEFFRGSPVYPFTGIASIKLNNSMLAGTGQAFLDLINFFLITYLDQEIEMKKNEGLKLFYIINENLGWNELTIYFFGNSMSAIQELVMAMRQYRLRDIQDYLTSLLSLDEFDSDTIRDFILPIFDTIGTNSLLSDLIKKPEGTGKDFLESHTIIATSVTYGFSYELNRSLGNKDVLMSKFGFDEKQYETFIRECNREGAISIGWKIKPGHEHAADELIRRCFPAGRDKVYEGIQTGKYPFTYPKTSISFSAYIAFAREGAKIRGVEKSRHVIKIRSLLHWDSKTTFRPFNPALHYYYDLNKFRILGGQIERIQQQLCKYPVPYTFKNQIENLIINYNDAVSDPLMYSYFIGLKSSLFSFLKRKFDRDLFDEEPEVRKFALQQPDEPGFIEGPDEDPDTTITISSFDVDSITEFIQNWNKAYWNRYFHSYYFTEINDFNIEHHGGIQQILFTYDTIYRLISRRVYGEHFTVPFVNVQVGPMITSTQFYNTINFIHLFRPMIYACECIHEAVNHLIGFLVQIRDGREYEFLFNPLNRDIDFDNEKDQEEFEERLRKRVGPRDAYESRYLNEHFGLNAIRHMVTDFSTYIMGYIDPIKEISLWYEKNSIESVRLFYHTHWFLFLLRSDLYCREDSGKGGWFFKESDFQALFMRFNLMFYLFLDLSPTDLEGLNKTCPSIELKPLWETESRRLLDLVYRLGAALKDEFLVQLKEYPDIVLKNGQTAITRFRDTIVSNVFTKSWDEMHPADKENFEIAIKYNRELIKGFHSFFCDDTNECNIIIRRSAIDAVGVGIANTNIQFHPGSGARTVFLDPKGHLFATSPEARTDIFLKNVDYIKKMWDLSLKISLRDYKHQGN